MNGVRVLVGTHKGGFILTSDARRKRWAVSGPHFAGWEIYHLKGSTIDPNRLYASQTSSWFGQVIQRSDDGGKTWEELPALRSAKGHLWQPGGGGMCLHPILQDPYDPRRIFIAVSAAGAFRTDDGGQTWLPVNRGLQSNYELPDPNAEVGHCVHNLAMHRSEE